MAITKNLTITVKEDKATLSEKMYVYLGDVGVDFYLAIVNHKAEFTATSMYNESRAGVSLLRDLENAYASVSIKRPSGETFTKGKIAVVDNKVKFTITQELTDQLDDVGDYLLQIHLHDGNTSTSNRKTIPPVNFQVKELLA